MLKRLRALLESTRERVLPEGLFVLRIPSQLFASQADEVCELLQSSERQTVTPFDLMTGRALHLDPHNGLLITIDGVIDDVLNHWMPALTQRSLGAICFVSDWERLEGENLSGMITNGVLLGCDLGQIDTQPASHMVETLERALPTMRRALGLRSVPITTEASSRTFSRELAKLEADGQTSGPRHIFHKQSGLADPGSEWISRLSLGAHVPMKELSRVLGMTPTMLALYAAANRVRRFSPG